MSMSISDNCPICLCEMERGRDVVSFNCKHTLHFSCYMEYMVKTDICEQKCMLCRGDIYSDEIKEKMHNLKCGVLGRERGRNNSPVVNNVNNLRVPIVNGNQEPIRFLLEALGLEEINLPRAPRNRRVVNRDWENNVRQTLEVNWRTVGEIRGILRDILEVVPSETTIRRYLNTENNGINRRRRIGVRGIVYEYRKAN